MLSMGYVKSIRDALEAGKIAPLQTPAALERVRKAEYALLCLDRLIEDEKCNGWSNWETWNVKLWLDNDAGTYECSRRLIRDWDGGISSADNLKEYCELVCLGDEPPANMATDLLNGALRAVNWQEIVQSIIDELAEA